MWGSTIDSSKATKFVEPIVDNALPAVDDPDRPIPDETETTQHAKPTDFLPINHGDDQGENSKPAFTGHQEDADMTKTWLLTLSRLLHTHKLILAGIGAVVVVGFGILYYLWKRRADRQRQRVAYTPLTSDEIQMDAVGRGRDEGALNDPDMADDLPPRTTNVHPPTGRALGFHSGFLDDDEPSAGLTPKYRDEPDDDETHLDESVVVRANSDEEFATPMDSREGSRERLT